MPLGSTPPPAEPAPFRTSDASGAVPQAFAPLDDLPLPVWVNDGTAVNAWVNLEQCRFTGRTRAEETGEDWATCLHPDDRDAYRARYAEALARQEAFRYEYRVRRADGECGGC